MFSTLSQVESKHLTSTTCSSHIPDPWRSCKTCDIHMPGSISIMASLSVTTSMCMAHKLVWLSTLRCTVSAVKLLSFNGYSLGVTACKSNTNGLAGEGCGTHHIGPLHPLLLVGSVSHPLLAFPKFQAYFWLYFEHMLDIEPVQDFGT